MALLVRAIFLMALPYLPKQGEILVCDFEDSAIGAEMVKRRPVVVVSRHDAHRSQLCTVVSLSTTAPTTPKAWHYHMPHLKVTGWSADDGCWAKCDMLATVSLQRLNKPYVKLRSGRNYVTHLLAPVDMAAVLKCIRALMQMP
jgi:uncharacterized protein YifN (PemK superfamily)